MPQWLDNLDDEVMVRRQQDFRGGMDGFADPAQIGDSTVQLLQNHVVEDNGRARLRPGADALGGSALAGARIEDLTYFDTPSLEYLFASISASLRKWDGATWSTIGAYPLGGSSIIEMEQGGNKLYVSAGSGQWYRYDGAAWSAALGTATGATGDPPNGASIMRWHTNRMFATGAISSENDQIYASAFGDAGTGQWDYTKFAFRVGYGEGEAITALATAKGFWLAVGKEGSLYVVNCDTTQTTAANWQIVRVAGSIGVVGKRSLVSFGDFLLAFGRDGIRRIDATPNQDTPWEISPPISEPVQAYIDRVNWSAAAKSVLHKYRHYLFAAIPLDSATEPSHVLVWNSRLQAWMGVWTGWTPTAIATSRFGGVERLNVGDSVGKVNQWKDYASSSLSTTYQENSGELASKLTGKAWNFDAPINWKDGSFAEVITEDTGGNVDIVAYLDGIERRRETHSLFRVSNQLPVSLPFDLALPNAEPVTMALDGLPEFREVAIGVETTSGKIKVKSIAVGAFLNTLKNE